MRCIIITDLPRQFPDHAIPVSIEHLLSILSIFDEADDVVESHFLGDLLGQVGAVSLVDVVPCENEMLLLGFQLPHHDVGIRLERESSALEDGGKKGERGEEREREEWRKEWKMYEWKEEPKKGDIGMDGIDRFVGG